MKVGPTLAQIQNDYGDQVKIVYKHFIVHDQAVPAALAACAAANQGKFGEMEKGIWEKGFASRDLSPQNMEKIAGELGLDLAKFKADMEGNACQSRIQEDQEQLHKVGVNGTPAFYINGRYISGAQEFPVFKALIDEELKKADAAIQGGIPVEDYYTKAVVEKGKKSLE